MSLKSIMSFKSLVFLCLIMKLFCTEASIIPTQSSTNVPILRNTEKDCWYKCNKTQGPCLWCGSEGMCCTQKQNWNDTSNGCTGAFGGTSRHECALKPQGTSELANLQAEFLSEAKSGNVDKLKAIYQKSKSPYIVYDVINTQDREGLSALHWSIRNRNIEAAEFIIEIGANVNTATNEKNSHEGETPLILASFNGLLSIVKKLVNNGAEIDTKRKNGFHAAEAAAQGGYLEILKFLIEKEPQVVDLKGSYGTTPLIEVAFHGHLNIVKFLLSHPEVDIDSQDNSGGSSLMAASLYNHTELVEFLVQEGANIELKMKSGSHAAYHAARKGNLKIFKFLVQNAPDVVDMKGYAGRTPLVGAAFKGHLNVVNYLLSQPNVDIDSQDIFGYTPLIWASYKNHEKIVQILLQKGADKLIKNDSGQTALDLARSKNFLKIIEILQQ